MQDIIALDLEKRDLSGKTVKKIRTEGKVPAVIHDHGKESVIVQGSYIDMLKAFQQAGKHHPVNLKVGDKKFTALIKDVDFDPKRHEIRHVVFNAVSANQKVEAEVPIRIDGEIPAQKTGLMVITQLTHVEVEAIPQNLPDELVVSGEGLVEIGDKLTVADIKTPDGVTILTELDHPICVIEETKAQMSEEDEAAEAAEGEESAEGEEKSAEAPIEEE
jgi:large subunit ribosomal protein L25